MGESKGVRKYLDIFVKIFLLVLGFSDFFGILPNELDLLDKFLTSAILVYFWFKLRPASFMFGKKSRFLDTSIIVAYYILVLNTFLRFLQPILSEAVYSSVSYSVNLFSIYGGTILLILIAIYVSFVISIGEKSVANSLLSVFDKKGKFFDKIKGDTFNIYSPLEFVFNFLILYIIGIYFFGLINQWFVVSLDKSLLVLAILFAVSDIKCE